MNLKDKILWVLAFIWTNIVPLLLVVSFSVGIFFNLWKVQMLSFWLSGVITIIIGGGILYGFGKLLKKW